MIIFPRVPDPSSLLWIDNLSRRSSALREECLDIAQASRHRPIESLAQDAENLCEQGDADGCAIVMTYLADIARERGRLGPALNYSKRAEHLFAQYPQSRCKHNHAVALYALGLVHQLLGSDQEAWDYYDGALEDFDDAQTKWTSISIEDDVKDRCREAIRKIEQLMCYVRRARALGGSSAVQLLTLVGCWPLDNHAIGADHLVVEAAIERATPNLHLRVSNRDYQLRSLNNNRAPELMFRPDDEYFVLEVPEELGNIMPEFQDAEFALINQSGRDRTGKFGATVEQDSQVLWGRFVRDAGETKFEVAYENAPLPAPRFIGEDDLNNTDQRTVGSVVGVFKEA